MPTYEYACQSCGTHIEVYQRFSDEPLRECSVCGGQLRKVFHPAGILFKGSGFYVTDSRASRSKAGGGSDDGGKSTSAESASRGSGASKDAAKGAKADKSDKGDTSKPSAAGSSGSNKERSA